MKRLACTLLLAACVTPKPAPQNPSPMVDSARAHQRVQERLLSGRRLTIDSGLPQPVEVLVTPAAEQSAEADLLIHFHGKAYLAMQAAEESGRALVVAVVNAGAGGGTYDRAFAGTRFREIVSKIEEKTGKRLTHRYLSGFSAGYGAVRAILRTDYDAIDGVMLLDGLHTSYIPERKPVAEGGRLDTKSLEPFRRLAADATSGGKRFLVTHSEIFPGTFASTTETADDLLQTLGLHRESTLKWGPLGMQQVSEAHRGSFTILGFAGNTAPDHIDHLHAIGFFLARFWE